MSRVETDVEMATSARDAASVTLAASLAAMGSPCCVTSSEKRGCSSELTAATADEADEMAEEGNALHISSR
jgi:hypothetical protein